MARTTIAQPFVNLLPVGTLAAVASTASLSYTRHPSAGLVGFRVLADGAGELAVDGLRYGGNPAVEADWYEVTTASGTTGGRAVVTANVSALLFVSGGPPTMRARFVATTTATVSVFEGWYASFGGGAA